MKKNIAKLMIAFSAAALMILFSLPVSAAIPYSSYNYDSNGELVDSVDIYEPIKVISGELLNVGDLSSPSDFYISNHSLYILDTGNNRIVKCDLNSYSAQSITINEQGRNVALAKDGGIFVDSNGVIYIADSDSQCVWVCNADGSVIHKILKPDSEYFDKNLEFLPNRIIGDTVGNIYVQCTGVYEGLAIFNSDFEFSGFFGSEKVETSAELLRSYFWKQLMTKEQKQSMASYVPTEICSMDISADNFIYTITPGKLVGDYKHTADSIRCLNPKGSDILESFMPKEVETSFNNDNRYLNFIDIAYSNDGFINVIDNRQGRVYQFDDNMQLVTAFAGLGSYVGTFSQPCAIETNNDNIFILDSMKNNITVFGLTDTGKTVHQALILYNSGDYTESMQPWLQVAEENPNFQLAYIGIGNALFNEGEYSKAMEYYELAKDTEGWSNAYREYRVIAMRKNVIWIILIIVALIASSKVIGVLTRNGKIPTMKALANNRVGLMWYSVFHPFDGFDKIRSRKIRSYGFTAIVFFFMVLLGVAEQQYMGKAFSMVDSSEVNILSVFAVRIIILLLFVIANWAIGELSDGKAKFGDIWLFSSIALVPYIICGFIRVALSHFLVDDEAVFMVLVLVVGIICSFALLMIAFSVFHEFEFGKSVFIFILTVIGMALIVILAFLIYNLAQNVIDFVKTVFSEAVFRINT